MQNWLTGIDLGGTKTEVILLDNQSNETFLSGTGLSLTHKLRTGQQLPARLPGYVFGGECDTPIVKAAHGDSSGVRGAAWLANT